MRQDKRTLARTAFATVLGIASIPLAGFTEARAQGTAQVDQPFPAYNQYPALPGFTPPNILPPDLQTELLRIRREVQTIFNLYFAEWQALTPPHTDGTTPNASRHRVRRRADTWRTTEFRREHV